MECWNLRLSAGGEIQILLSPRRFKQFQLCFESVVAVTPTVQYLNELFDKNQIFLISFLQLTES